MPGPDGLMVLLTPGQRKIFRDAREARGLRACALGVSAATIASIERGSRRHHEGTLCTVAQKLGMTPEAAENVGLPQVAARLLRPDAGSGPAAPPPPDTGPEPGLPPVTLADKIRWGMAARCESNNSARAVALELTEGLQYADLEAIASFMGDVAHMVTQTLQHQRDQRRAR